MGQGGSVWVHIEGIRRWTVDLDIDNPKYEEYIKDMWSKMGSRFWEGLENIKSKNDRKHLGLGYGTQVPKSFVRPMGVF